MSLKFIIPVICGGAVGEEEPPPEERDDTAVDGTQIFLIHGDSIGEGRGEAAGPTPTAGTVYEWIDTVSPREEAEIGASDLEDAVIGSPWPRFGIDYNAATSRRVLFINRGYGGSNFANPGNNADWSTTPGTLYASLQLNVTTALAAKGITHLKAIISICGINDAAESVDLSTIQAAITSLYDRFESDYPGTPVLVVNIGRLPAGISTTRIDAIRGYIETEVAARSDFHMVADLRDYATDNPEYYDDDDIHLNQTGNNVLGAQIAAYVIANL